ncbi:hypothetical protein [Streptomyces abyssomicinicus]|uniref:hypothetical protein n=1 Tax=Streptomyces abyssomicinicus TaxID=574929 RepID=UPI001FE5E15E|nr:hypothetical protein [Streptomyces abyssomicinicus]
MAKLAAVACWTAVPLLLGAGTAEAACGGLTYAERQQPPNPDDISEITENLSNPGCHSAAPWIGAASLGGAAGLGWAGWALYNYWAGGRPSAMAVPQAPQPSGAGASPPMPPPPPPPPPAPPASAEPPPEPGGRPAQGMQPADVRGMGDTIHGSARMPGGQIPYRDLSPKAKHLVRQLESHGHIGIRAGEVSVSHLTELQRFSAVEHAIIQNAAGELRLFSGTEYTSTIPVELRGQGYDFIAHTHPEDRMPGPPTDLERVRGIANSMSRDLENKVSDHVEVVVSRDGNLRFFDGDGILDLPSGEFPSGGPVNDRGFIVPVPRIG